MNSRMRRDTKLLIGRILFLEGTPDLVTRDPIHVGKDVPEMLQNDLQLEYDVAAALKQVIKLCEQEQDYQTREVLNNCWMIPKTITPTGWRNSWA